MISLIRTYLSLQNPQKPYKQRVIGALEVCAKMYAKPPVYVLAYHCSVIYVPF